MKHSSKANEEVIVANAALGFGDDNYDEFDAELNPAKLGESLLQVNSLKAVNHRFQLYDGKHLLIDVEHKKKRRQFRVDLALLNAEPVHHRVIEWKWLAISLAGICILVLAIFLVVRQLLGVEIGIALGVVGLGDALLFFAIFLYRMQDDYIFHSRFGGARLFVMENKKPDLRQFEDFLGMLEQRIHKLWRNITIEAALISELKMCRRLRDTQIINEASYTRARTAIFRHERYKA